MLPTLTTGNTEGSYCCIQLDGTASPFCVHLDVNASYVRYIACENNLWSKVNVM